MQFITVKTKTKNNLKICNQLLLTYFTYAVYLLHGFYIRCVPFIRFGIRLVRCKWTYGFKWSYTYLRFWLKVVRIFYIVPSFVNITLPQFSSCDRDFNKTTTYHVWLLRLQILYDLYGLYKFLYFLYDSVCFVRLSQTHDLIGRWKGGVKGVYI